MNKQIDPEKKRDREIDREVEEDKQKEVKGSSSR